MDLLLVEEAGRAQDIADIFSVIRSNDEDNVRDLTVAITALNHLSCALRELNQQIDAVGNKLSRPFADDLTLLQNSVAFTLQDLWTICGKIPPDALAVDYRLAWREVCRYCTNMGKQPLHLRLETYQLFAYALCKQLKRYANCSLGCRGTAAQELFWSGNSIVNDNSTTCATRYPICRLYCAKSIDSCQPPIRSRISLWLESPKASGLPRSSSTRSVG